MAFIRPIIKGGGDNLGTKSITENGTYNAIDDSLDGYSEVTVNVSSEEPSGYVRVEGVPNGEDILANAPIIESGGINYYPIYYICAMDTFTTYSPTKTGTGVSTGADAYVFSDEPTTLYVGNTTHTFDPTQDFATSENWKCRYVIMYATEANKNNANGITINIYNYRATFEIIGSQYLILSSTSAVSGYSSPASVNQNLKYINLENSTIYNNTISVSYFCNQLQSAIEYKFPTSLTTISGNNFCSNNWSLNNLSLPSLTTISGTYFCNYCTSLKNLSLPEFVGTTKFIGTGFCNYCTSLKNLSLPKLTSIGGADFLSDCKSLNYFEILNTVTTIYTNNVNSFAYVDYIGLPTDFDIDAVNFTGASGYPKSQSWFHHLATQLKDNSGGTTKTMVLGATNIALIPSADAVTISAKNWTLS